MTLEGRRRVKFARQRILHFAFWGRSAKTKSMHLRARTHSAATAKRSRLQPATSQLQPVGVIPFRAHFLTQK